MKKRVSELYVLKAQFKNVDMKWGLLNKLVKYRDELMLDSFKISWTVQEKIVKWIILKLMYGLHWWIDKAVHEYLDLAWTINMVESIEKGETKYKFVNMKNILEKDVEKSKAALYAVEEDMKPG